MNLRETIKRNPALKQAALLTLRVTNPVRRQGVIGGLRQYPRYLRDLRRFRQSGGTVHWADLDPQLADRSSSTSYDAHYLYQAAWAAQQVRRTAPPYHVDIGSHSQFVAMLAALTPIYFVDFRPLQLTLENFQSINGEITRLPFKDKSLSSVSCLHVIEHIGLGRYGDPIDPGGFAAACLELQRVVGMGGSLLISTPIGRDRIQFNGQRVSAPSKILDLFEELTLVNMAKVDGSGSFRPQCTPDDPPQLSATGSDCELGLFHLQREK